MFLLPTHSLHFGRHSRTQDASVWGWSSSGTHISGSMTTWQSGPSQNDGPPLPEPSHLCNPSESDYLRNMNKIQVMSLNMAVLEQHEGSLICTTWLDQWKFGLLTRKTVPSRQSAWLPSRHTQMSEHCSSWLRNKMNFLRRSWVWIVVMLCCQKADINTSFLTVVTDAYRTCARALPLVLA